MEVYGVGFRIGCTRLRRPRALTHYVVHNIMQSIFSPAARRQTLRE
jgi:hypothetical protein